MSAYMVMALGAFVVSIMAGLSGAGATPISRRAESKASGEEQPVMPQLPPEVIAVLRRNALLAANGGSPTGAPEVPLSQNPLSIR
jgi:Na+/citrate or Na+/malate symporter